MAIAEVFKIEKTEQHRTIFVKFNSCEDRKKLKDKIIEMTEHFLESKNKKTFLIKRSA